MVGYQGSHTDRLRAAGLKWLEVEDRQRRHKPDHPLGRSLKNGLQGTAWNHELGTYPVRAVQALRQKTGRLHALQAAGKTAAVGRALYAVLLQQFYPEELPEDDAHRVTFLQLPAAFPRAPSGFEYTPQMAHYPPLAKAIHVLDAGLPRPVEPGDLPAHILDHGWQVCLAASQLFMDYLVELCPQDQTITLPQAGVRSGVTKPWRPNLEI